MLIASAIEWVTRPPFGTLLYAANDPTLAHDGVAAYSGLIPANLITSAHFLTSALTNTLNSAGVITRGSTPKAMRRAFRVRSAAPALISAFSLSMTAVGEPVGAQMPNQPTAT